jgi:low temperature requirement protein LtrA
VTTDRRDRPGPDRARPRELLRPRGGSARVTNVELYFDLVYVFAVTQLSTYLIRHPDATGALHGALLLAMVWLLWVYTTWVTNWLDPERIPVRLMLLALALGSLVISAALPGAFDGRGLAVGVAYAVIQIGRSIFAVAALRGHQLQRNFQRILSWCLVSGTLAVAGGCVTGPARAALWLGAVGVDVLGGVVGFYTPGLGRSRTQDWAIEGSHFAERCQAFILIALGESIVVVGAALSHLTSVSIREIAAFLAAFLSSVALWWLYFDRSAEEGARVLATSDDPGRLGRSAYHLIHPFMVAGIIVVAAGDKVALTNPGAGGLDAARWQCAVPGRARRVPGRPVAPRAVGEAWRPGADRSAGADRSPCVRAGTERLRGRAADGRGRGGLRQPGGCRRQRGAWPRWTSQMIMILIASLSCLVRGPARGHRGRRTLARSRPARSLQARCGLPSCSPDRAAGRGQAAMLRRPSARSSQGSGSPWRRGMSDRPRR